MSAASIDLNSEEPGQARRKSGRALATGPSRTSHRTFSVGEKHQIYPPASGRRSRGLVNETRYERPHERVASPPKGPVRQKRQAQHLQGRNPKGSTETSSHLRKKSSASKKRAIDPVEARKVQTNAKRKRIIESGTEPTHVNKRPRRERNQHRSSSPANVRGKFVENWVNQSSETRPPPTDEKQILEILSNMPRKHAAPLPSPRDSLGPGTTTTSASKRSDRSTASTRDLDYHKSLGFRNIYVERQDPPRVLMQRAQRLIARPRASPEIDDETAEKLRRNSRRLRNESEDVIIKQLASHLIPAMTEVPDPRLELNADQPWSNAVPLPLDQSILINPLPLPKPKPDLAFGYSEAAFTRAEQGAIDLLISDEFGQSYAVPDSKLRFPFLSVEFKSQAKNGTHYIATNQAAGAGAVALNGNLELIQRSFGLASFDYNEPQFFSVTMDHEMARINVHWIRAPARGELHSFHVEGLSNHLLNDPNGIRALIRAVKNILDYGVDTRLQSLCKALEAYRDTVVQNRQAANYQAHKAQADISGDGMSANIISTLPEKLAATRKQRRPTKPVMSSVQTVDTYGTQPGDDGGVGLVRGLHDLEATAVSTSGRQRNEEPIRRTRSSTRRHLIEVQALETQRLHQHGRSP